MSWAIQVEQELLISATGRPNLHGSRDERIRREAGRTPTRARTRSRAACEPGRQAGRQADRQQGGASACGAISQAGRPACEG